MAGKNHNNEGPDESEFREPTPAERRLEEQLEKDRAAQKLGQARNAQMEIIKKLGGNQPIDTDMIAYNADLVESQFGSDGYFTEHTVMKKTIAQAMAENKDREIAKDAIEVLSRRLQEAIATENKREHAANVRSWQYRAGMDDHQKREGGGLGGGR